jgi:hypothetical protein
MQTLKYHARGGMGMTIKGHGTRRQIKAALKPGSVILKHDVTLPLSQFSNEPAVTQHSKH